MKGNFRKGRESPLPPPPPPGQKLLVPMHSAPTALPLTFLLGEGTSKDFISSTLAAVRSLYNLLDWEEGKGRPALGAGQFGPGERRRASGHCLPPSIAGQARPSALVTGPPHTLSVSWEWRA